MLTLTAYQIGAVAVAALVYAIAISHEPLLALDDARETRWMITAGGIVLVIVIAPWQGPVTMLDLFVAFGVSAGPIWVRAAWFGHRERKRAELEKARNGQTTAA